MVKKIKPTSRMTRLGFYRREAQISQNELAFVTGISRTAYQMIEAGFKAPTLEQKQKISELIGVDQEKIFGKKEQSFLKETFN